MTGSSLQGKVAVVTGASKGIGRALAIGLARDGAHVAVNYKSDHEGAEVTCSAIRALGGEAVAIGADVAHLEDVRRLIDAAYDQLGRIDVLVNNAGRTRFGPAQNVTEDDWDDVINTNLRGAFFATIAAAEAMGDPGGSVINISSIAATLMVAYHAVYTTSKGGLEAMTRQLALELAPRVRVNAIAPAATSMERNWEYAADFDESWSRVTPLGRVATPEDFVAPLLFLASDASAFVTGEVLHVDGGWTIKGHHPDMEHHDFERDRRQS